MQSIIEMENLTKAILYDLEKGNIEYNDDKFQFFLPVGLYFANFDLLKVVAENTLIEEDNKVVQEFLSKVESIVEVNGNQLQDAVEDKLKLFMEDL